MHPEQSHSARDLEIRGDLGNGVTRVEPSIVFPGGQRRPSGRISLGPHSGSLRETPDAPREVQDAVERNQLPMTMALRIMNLSQDQRRQIADQIAAGVPARVAVAAFNVPMPTPPIDPMTAYRDVLLRLERMLPVLAEHADAIVGTALNLERCIPLLERARDVFAALAEMEIDLDAEPAASDS